VLQTSGDLGLQQETASALLIITAHSSETLEGYFTVQLLVLSQENLSQTPSGMELERLVAQAGQGRVTGSDKVFAFP
jgi:hypothetical protein